MCSLKPSPPRSPRQQQLGSAAGPTPSTMSQLASAHQTITSLLSRPDSSGTGIASGSDAKGKFGLSPLEYVRNKIAEVMRSSPNSNEAQPSSSDQATLEAQARESPRSQSGGMSRTPPMSTHSSEAASAYGRMSGSISQSSAAEVENRSEVSSYHERGPVQFGQSSTPADEGLSAVRQRSPRPSVQTSMYDDAAPKRSPRPSSIGPNSGPNTLGFPKSRSPRPSMQGVYTDSRQQRSPLPHYPQSGYGVGDEGSSSSGSGVGRSGSPGSSSYKPRSPRQAQQMAIAAEQGLVSSGEEQQHKVQQRHLVSTAGGATKHTDSGSPTSSGISEAGQKSRYSPAARGGQVQSSEDIARDSPRVESSNRYDRGGREVDVSDSTVREQPNQSGRSSSRGSGGNGYPESSSAQSVSGSNSAGPRGDSTMDNDDNNVAGSNLDSLQSDDDDDGGMVIDESAGVDSSAQAMESPISSENSQQGIASSSHRNYQELDSHTDNSNDRLLSSSRGGGGGVGSGGAGGGHHSPEDNNISSSNGNGLRPAESSRFSHSRFSPSGGITNRSTSQMAAESSQVSSAPTGSGRYSYQSGLTRSDVSSPAQSSGPSTTASSGSGPDGHNRNSPGVSGSTNQYEMLSDDED